MTTSASKEDVYAEILAAFDDHADPGEPLTTPEIAAWFDCTRRTVYNRLQHLVECGHLRTKKVGSRARVWWRPPGVDRSRYRSATRDGSNQREEHASAVFRAVGRAVTQSGTRQDVARSLCESLLNIDPYRWVVAGTFASSFERFEEWATVDGGDGRLADALEPERGASLGESLVDAARTGEVRVGRVQGGESTDGWQDVATSAGIRSYAAVPLLAKDAVSGVLGIYATRPDAFEGERRRFVADLGEIVGYALTQTAVLDETVELEFGSDHLAETFLEHADATMELYSDAGVSLPDGTSRRYWTVTGMTADEFRTVLDELPTIRDSRLLRTVGDTTRFELTVTEDSIATAFGQFDGELHSATLTDGEFRFRGRFPRTSDAQRILDGVREVFSDVELLSQRRVLRPASLRQLVKEHLTDRQHTVLKLACSAGYYQQPRQSTGVELAAQLGVTKQTFHHHLRNAEATVFRQVFGAEDA